MPFDRKEFDQFLLDNGCIGFFNPPIVLKSGRPGWWYANLRDLLKSVALKKRLAKFVYSFVMNHNLRPDYFLGVPDGATPLGESVNELIDYKDLGEVPATILRSKAKTHGDPKDKYSVGPLKAGKHVVLLEDVTTTGGSSMEHILRLQEIGIIIDKLVSCVYRMERRDNGKTADEVLNNIYGVEYLYLTGADTLLPKAYEILNPDRIVAENLEEYFRTYGITQIKLL